MSDPQPNAVVGDMNEPIEAEGKCPVAHDRLPHPTQGDPNRGWWPERLNLKILAKNPAVANPLGEVSHQAVYDVLRVLTGAGLVRRIQPPGSVARYEARVGDNHHHVVCRGCGVIADVDCAVGDTPCLTASDDRGFAIDEAEVVYWGRCPNCVAARPE